METTLPLPYLTGDGSRDISKRILPSCCGELILNVLPASAQTWSAILSMRSVRRTDSSASKSVSTRMPVCSIGASTGASGRSISS